MNADRSKLNQLVESIFFGSSKDGDGNASKDTASINQNKAESPSEEGTRDKALKRFEEVLSKAWTESQTKSAMEIVQGFGQNVTPSERENAYVSNIFSSK